MHIRALLRLMKVSIRSSGLSDSIAEKCSMASLYLRESIAASPSFSNLSVHRRWKPVSHAQTMLVVLFTMALTEFPLYALIVDARVLA